MTENFKKYKLPLVLLVLSVSFLLVLAFLLFRGKQKEIPLNRYLKIHCTGSNGSGVLEAEFDWETFSDKEKKKIHYCIIGVFRRMMLKNCFFPYQ